MNLDELTRLENDTIRAFVRQAAEDGYLSGSVLDYGCGAQPYREIVELAGSSYQGFDRELFPANMSRRDVDCLPGPYDAVLCTQVVQFVPDPTYLLHQIRRLLREDGHLVMTGPTNWPEVNVGQDLWRFTLAGAVRLVELAGMTEIVARARAGIGFDGFSLPLGWGIVARA